ncbi:preprotein translocase subunit YajC [Aromatoleum sp.]|uniref:preprotein translocase subunit YajC n=1 Tax=Aromatoleum sp. TaxID=2307007 RepID=UPI002FC95105
MFISNAYAQAAADPTGGLMGMLPLILMFIVLWFLMIRPQMKRAKEHKAMVAAIAKGDEVVTQGGIAGRVTQIGENYLHVEVADNVNIVVQVQAVATVLPKGTLKTL